MELAKRRINSGFGTWHLPSINWATLLYNENTLELATLSQRPVSFLQHICRSPLYIVSPCPSANQYSSRELADIFASSIVSRFCNNFSATLDSAKLSVPVQTYHFEDQGLDKRCFFISTAERCSYKRCFNTTEISIILCPVKLSLSDYLLFSTL